MLTLRTWRRIVFQMPRTNFGSLTGMEMVFAAHRGVDRTLSLMEERKLHMVESLHQQKPHHLELVILCRLW